MHATQRGNDGVGQGSKETTDGGDGRCITGVAIVAEVGGEELKKEEVGEEEPLRSLPGQWGALLREGRILTALLLSTSFSEKYKGRHMHPGSVAEVRVPTIAESGETTRTLRPRLLHRSGNREAVAFIWLGDEGARDSTLYVAFSPMRYRSQLFKIYCAGVVDDELDDGSVAKQTAWTKPQVEERGRKVVVPISAYIHGKLKRLWGQQGLWGYLSQCAHKFKTHRIIFSGISHGAALAQAAALQFRIREPTADVLVVTWNAYRWTNDVGRAVAEIELGGRLLPLVLSRRGIEPHATRYWDSVTGFPANYVPMPNLVFLDADTGQMFVHTAPNQNSSFGAAFLMRMFELHFAKAAINATKKATVLSLGGRDEQITDDMYSVGPLAEALQQKLLNTSEHFVRSGRRIKKATSAEIAHVRNRFSSASRDLRRGATELHPSARAKPSVSKPWQHCFAWCWRN